MTEAPAPLVPADVDLRNFKFMPLEVRRLLTSETWLEAADEPKIGHAAMCLWCEAWHQVPAASLPASDRALARLAMCEMKIWDKIKDRVLRDWVLCSDGRLYHPVVAEKALESWSSKTAQRRRTRAATEERIRRRDDQRNDVRNVERDEERNVLRYDVRDGDRDVLRVGERDVHQLRKKEREEGKESKSLSQEEGTLSRVHTPLPVRRAE